MGRFRKKKHTTLTQLNQDIVYFQKQLEDARYHYSNTMRLDERERLSRDMDYYQSKVDSLLEELQHYRWLWESQLLVYQQDSQGPIMAEDPYDDGFVVDITELVKLYENNRKESDRDEGSDTDRDEVSATDRNDEE